MTPGTTDRKTKDAHTWAVEDLRPAGSYGAVVRARRRKLGPKALADIPQMDAELTADLEQAAGKLLGVLFLGPEGDVRRDELGWFSEKVPARTAAPRQKAKRNAEETSLEEVELESSAASPPPAIPLPTRLRAEECVDIEREHQRWLESEAKHQVKLLARGGGAAQSAHERLKEIAAVNRASRFRESIYKAFAVSLRIDARDTILAVARRPIDGVRTVRCKLRESLPPIITGTKEAAGKSVILLDGTADEAMTQAVFKYVAPVEQVNVLAQPGAYTLTQCYDRTFAPTGLTKASGAHSDSNLYKLWRHICKLAAKAPLRSPLGADGAPDGGVFVACPLKSRSCPEESRIPGKCVRPALQRPARGRYLPQRSLRGHHQSVGKA